MQRSTSSGSHGEDLKGTARTPTQASGAGFSDLKKPTTPTQSCLPRDWTPEAQGSSGQCLHSAPRTCTDVVPNPDQGSAQKYWKGDQVYRKNDRGTDGVPTMIRLKICCTRYNPQIKEREYRVKDMNDQEIGWYRERDLERLSTQI